MQETRNSATRGPGNLSSAGLVQRFREITGLFLRFAAVGVVGTIAHYLTLILLVEGFGHGPVAGSSLGFIVGALVNYVLNYRYTFRSDRRHVEALPRFYLIATAGFFFNGAIMWLLADRLGVHYLISQVVASGIILVWNFVANWAWTFRRRKR